MRTDISIPVVALVAGTRLALGLGIGLLVAHKLSREQRQAAGWALVAVGGLSTIPLLTDVLGHASGDGQSRREQSSLARGSQTSSLTR